MTSEQTSWTDADFENMGWHDVQIHAVGWIPERYELCFDIDYIVEWLCPADRPGEAKFRLAPATLLFSHVSDVRFQTRSSQGAISITEVQRQDRELIQGAEIATWMWTLICDEGKISFRAGGFTQYLRRSPVMIDSQTLTSDERGGLDFGRQ